jgi:hypothetical protein
MGGVDSGGTGRGPLQAQRVEEASRFRRGRRCLT